MTTKRDDAVVPVRIPRELLRKLEIVAKREDRSRSYIVRELLERAVAQTLGRKGDRK
jgi:predicted DNA-binding protein